MEWIQDVIRQSKNDPRYQSLLREAEMLEGDFTALRQSLPEEQRILLDRYLSLCEEMDHLLMLMAYGLGKSAQE